MYENGNDSMLISILQRFHRGVRKRAEYAYSIARYDQQMLEQYDQLQQGHRGEDGGVARISRRSRPPTRHLERR